ncbi:MAG: carbohydrate kinase family protein [Anaerolineae bacterium]|nr:carbohydrate kinase family protein [Anaerolineae bacterium]
MDAVVFGNVTLDTLCYPVDDVPRNESISFERAIVAPGGCGSNVAIGLCALGVETALVARLGTDDAAVLVERYWERVGLDTRFVRRLIDAPTAVSVGLVDSDAQPRFVHTPGANATLSVGDLDIPALVAEGARILHVGAFLVLPGVSGEQLAGQLAEARTHGLLTSLDVAISRNRSKPADLWPCLPHVDFFFCNAREAHYLTGVGDPVEAARALRSRGAWAVVLKLGADGCWVEGDGLSKHVPGLPAEVVDTTGAGDAFAAGFIASMLRDNDLPSACRAGSAAGARVVSAFGAVGAWFQGPA